jgi:hypothetical protein
MKNNSENISQKSVTGNTFEVKTAFNVPTIQKNSVTPLCNPGNSRVTLLKDEHLAYLYTKVDEMLVGEVFDLSEIRPGGRDIFIECCKHRIDYMGDLEADGNWQKIRKIENYFI